MSGHELAFVPTRVLAPGRTLVEVLDDRGMTQSDLATRTGLSTKHINQIVKGAAPISAETALLLERATGVPARMWTALESAFQVAKSEQTESERLASDLDWLRSMPVDDLVRRGWVPRRHDPVDMLRELCNFFGVANRSAWEALWEKPTAYRRSKAFVSDPSAMAAWLRIGELEAAKIKCEPFDRSTLVSCLVELRDLTRDSDPATWIEPLVQTCSNAGVAVVLEPEIHRARVVGAARWVSPSKAVVQLSLRHRWSDIFWFTLFHELGHLLLHSKKDVFINDQGPHSGAEQEADAFAAQVLIPRDHDFRLASLTTDQDVIDFADEIGIGPDIVVGRLQFEGRWAYSRGNGLKRRFVFKQS